MEAARRDFYAVENENPITEYKWFKRKLTCS